MEKFEIDFKSKRLRAYLDDVSQVYLAFEDLRPIVGDGDPFEAFGAEYITFPEEDKEVLAVCEFEILSRPVFRTACPDFWNWLVVDGLREIRIHIANRNFEEGASEKGGRFLLDENQILTQNLKNARDKVAELEKMIADLRSEKLALQDRYLSVLKEQNEILKARLDNLQGR